MPKELFTLKIFLKDSPKTDNKYNKLILEFLNNNLEEILSYGCYIRLILLNNTNIDKFLQMNIKNIPALYDDEDDISITGVEDIIKYIVSKCTIKENENNNTKPQYNYSHGGQKSQTPKKSKKNMNDDEDPSSLRGYLINEILKNDGFEDAIDMETVKMREDVYNKNKEILMSKNPNSNKYNLSTAKSNLSNKTYNTSIENRTDKIDAMYDANKEITQTKKISSLVNNDDAAFKAYWDNQEETE